MHLVRFQPSAKPPTKRKRAAKSRRPRKSRPLTYNWVERLPAEVTHLIAYQLAADDICALLRTCRAAQSRISRSMLYRASVLKMELGIVKWWYKEVLSRIVFYLDEFPFNGAMMAFFAGIFNGDLPQVQGFLDAGIGHDVVACAYSNWMPRPRRLETQTRNLPARSCMSIQTQVTRTAKSWSPHGWVIYPETHQADGECIFTPLHLAVWCGWEDVVQALVTAGADVDSLDGQGLCDCAPRFSPLHLLRCRGQEGIRAILESKANPEALETDSYVLLGDDEVWFDSELGRYVS